MTPRPPVLRRGLLVLATLLAGAGAAVVLGRLETPGDRGLLAAKRDELAAHGDAYDTLFVGSSRVYRNIDPLHFDEVVRRAGRASHAFNLGLPGMSFLEALSTSHAALDDRSPRLRRLVVELLPPSTRLFGDNAHSERVRAWHDVRTTFAATRLCLADEAPAAERVASALQHLQLGAQRALHVTEGRLLLRSLLSPAYDEATTAILPTLLARHGHLPLEEDPDPLVTLRRERFLRETDSLLERTRAFVAGTLGDTPTDAVAVELLDDLARHATACDVRLVLVGMPTHRSFESELRAASDGRLTADVISLADPVAHPEFYEPDHRFDANHLDRRTTLQLTELLAERIAALGP